MSRAIALRTVVTPARGMMRLRMGQRRAHPDSDSQNVGLVNILEAQICSGGSRDFCDRDGPLNRKPIIAAHPAVDLGRIELELAGETLDREPRDELSELSDPVCRSRSTAALCCHMGPSIHRRA